MDRALRLDFGSFDRKYKSTHNETLSLCGRTQSHVHEEFEGLPSAEFLIKLDPLLAGLRERLFRNTYTADESMGIISAEWAEKLGISTNVIIGVGAFDCHMGAVGAEIESYDFVRVMGTSTCDMLIAPTEEIGHLLIKGICGQVDGSIIPNMLGMEAGQSAYGEYYAWFQQIVVEQVRELLGEKAAEELSQKLIPYLSEKASLLPITENDPVAIDWINGRRTPDANHALKAAFRGLNLGTDAIKIFKMIVEATAFGSKAIVDRFIEEGVPIKQVIAIGGVAKKSPFKIVFKPVVKSTEEITAICKAANATQNCVGMHTFSSAKMWINGLNILQVPLLHLHSQFNRDFHTLILTWIL